jgi:hypothetical protein
VVLTVSAVELLEDLLGAWEPETRAVNVPDDVDIEEEA